jgi:hypothetical protein
MEHPLNIDEWVATGYGKAVTSHFKKWFDLMYPDAVFAEEPLNEIDYTKLMSLGAREGAHRYIEEQLYQLYLKSKASGSECPTNAT